MGLLMLTTLPCTPHVSSEVGQSGALLGTKKTVGRHGGRDGMGRDGRHAAVMGVSLVLQQSVTRPPCLLYAASGRAVVGSARLLRLQASSDSLTLPASLFQRACLACCSESRARRGVVGIQHDA
jgi:hypothetical protein